MGSLTLRNLRGVVTGRAGPGAWLEASSIHVDAGRIISIGDDDDASGAIVVDGGGNTAVPGLIDSHSHPLVGEFSPVLNSTSWITHYLHCGVTTFISAGEVVMPGLPVNPPDPRFIKHLALVTKTSFDAVQPAGARVIGGTPVLLPGLTEEDFDDFAAAGIGLVKFIYYDFDAAPSGEAQRYLEWSRARGMKVKLHAGGTSYLGDSAVVGAERVLAIRPDIVAHLNGGPIPPPRADVERIVRETDCAYEIVPGGNPRTTELILRLTAELGSFERLLLGTDTPGGTGEMPRAMLRLTSDVASTRGFSPTNAVAAATGNVARAHGLDLGVLEPGRPADIVLLGPIRGSVATDALDAFAQGDIPGVALVVTRGEIRLTRSTKTPPPIRPARVVRAPGIPA
jgi:amidohydrolase family protein